jgi:hypothetical protein
MDGVGENLSKCWIVIPDQIRGTSGDALVGKVIRIPDNDRCANLVCLKESFRKCI